MAKTRWPLALVFALGVFATACSGGSGGDGGSGGSEGSGGASGAIQLTIQDLSFHPSTLPGSAGQTLTIQVSNKDSVEHSFTLDDGSVSQDFEGGDSGSVQVTLPDSGTVGWHCKYHPTTMKGTIQIT
jgi:plastocyanin